jgi:hypothetical protein
MGILSQLHTYVKEIIFWACASGCALCGILCGMDVNKFWNIVKREVARQNTSFEWLYRKTGIPKGTFSSWKSRNIFPRADEVYKIACALDVSVAYLLTGTDRPEGVVHPEAREIAQTLAVFDAKDIESVLALVRAMARRYT